MTDASIMWSAHQLAEFVASVTEQRTLGHAVDRAIDQLCETFDAAFSAVMLDGDLLGSTGFGRQSDEMARSLPATLGRGGQVTLAGAGVCDILSAEHVADGVPCQVYVGRVGATEFSAVEHHLIRNMARVLGTTLQRFRLIESLQERQQLLERLSVVQRSIARRAGLDNVLNAIIVGVVELLDADTAAIRFTDDQNPGQRSIIASHGLSRDLLALAEKSPITEGLSGRAMREERVVVDVVENFLPESIRSASGLRDDMIVVAAPIHDGFVNIGAIVVGVDGSKRESFTEGEREALSLFAEHASIALTDARGVEALRLAMHDPLTRLPNRAMFEEQLNMARQVGPRGGSAVLFIDLDGFKAINDKLGHKAGDELLAEIAARLDVLVRPGDLVARHGGDEFTVLLQHLAGTEDAAVVAQRILDGLRDPFTIRGESVVMLASIGIAFDDGNLAADLVERADRAMYEAKQRGRGRIELYESDGDESSSTRTWVPTI